MLPGPGQTVTYTARLINPGPELNAVTLANAIPADLTFAGALSASSGDAEFDFRFKIIEGAGAYVCGEETALLSSIEGQRPEVRIRPPYPTQEGLFNKPTIVNNVETLAAIPFIINKGGSSYASLGTENLLALS